MSIPIAERRRNSETKKLREKLRDFENRQLISSFSDERTIDFARVHQYIP